MPALPPLILPPRNRRPATASAIPAQPTPTTRTEARCTADLHLALKDEYFDAIKAGTKTEEYRLCNQHWINRLEKPAGHYDRIILTRG